ncbi:MAG: rhodanese-like domain-containing protein [Planctomycetota bacterium]
MEPTVLAALAGSYVLALVALLRASAARRAAEDAAREAERRAGAVRLDLEAALDTQSRLLAKLASGEHLTKEMIEDGQLWKDIDENEAKAMLAGSPAPYLVDVRTPDETAAGIIPGAKLIPMDEIEARRAELPSDGTPIVVYCAAGGRSAAVCDFLAQNGVDGLHNLLGGFSEWSGASEAPSS